MKKILMFLAIIFIACSGHNKPDQQVSQQDLYALHIALRPKSSFLPAPKDTVLERIIHRSYLKNQARALANNQYLNDNLVALKFNSTYVIQQDLLRQQIFFDLNNLKHTTRDDNKHLPYFIKDYGSQGVFYLSSRQLLRIYVLLEALKDKKFIKNIGQLIENDLHDYDAKKYGYRKTEHGGLVVMEPAVKFMNIKSATALPNLLKDFYPGSSKFKVKNTNNYYQLPLRAYQDNNYIAEYHIHATEEDNSKYAGPSFASGINGIDKRLFFFLDLGIAINEVSKIGESHNFVITKLKGKHFNIDYYGGERIKFERPKIIILDLGNYSY